MLEIMLPSFFICCWTTFTSPQLCWLSCLYAKNYFPEFLCEHLLLYNAHEAAAFIAAVRPPGHFPFHWVLPQSSSDLLSADIQQTCLCLYVCVCVCVCVCVSSLSRGQHAILYNTRRHIPLSSLPDWWRGVHLYLYSPQIWAHTLVKVRSRWTLRKLTNRIFWISEKKHNPQCWLTSTTD